MGWPLKEGKRRLAVDKIVFSGWVGTHAGLRGCFAQSKNHHCISFLLNSPSTDLIKFSVVKEENNKDVGKVSAVCGFFDQFYSCLLSAFLE